MSFQMSKFGNGKTRETMQKKLNEKKTKRIVRLFSGIEILETAVEIPIKH